ncbi:hypothetical protein AWZ03_007945 [Drosophila navojoa]|uniref:Uncharacterized protein n=1 Tax=Drosophila navojoa TaxID=7232 RepID=A0A484BCE3_DRONA|nr:hypothetical protein AWZ03_007945 [Drosophila navojoa]
MSVRLSIKHKLHMRTTAVKMKTPSISRASSSSSSSSQQETKAEKAAVVGKVENKGQEQETAAGHAN